MKTFASKALIHNEWTLLKAANPRKRANWLVMAAWLLQLRSGLLLPADEPAQRDAKAEATQLQSRMVDLQAVQALAAWLDHRAQLGRDVFTRGYPPSRAQSPELFSVSIEPTSDLDVIEFLWASLALFDDGQPEPNTSAVYRPPHLTLYPIGEARDRILHLLVDASGEVSFEQLLPEPPELAEGETLPTLRLWSAWSSTFVASLELAKQGAIVLEQEREFQLISVALGPA